MRGWDQAESSVTRWRKVGLLAEMFSGRDVLGYHRVMPGLHKVPTVGPKYPLHQDGGSGVVLGVPFD